MQRRGKVLLLWSRHRNLGGLRREGEDLSQGARDQTSKLEVIQRRRRMMLRG